MEGIIIFNKPRGIKSTEVVKYFKKKLETKVGHGGTLDPLASGLLIIGTGEYTQDLNFFLTKSKKKYVVEAILGIVSSSYDLEGDLSFTEDKLPTFEQVKSLLKEFEGESYQVPPLFSAIKIKGVPLYKLARQQKITNNFLIPQRKIKIEMIKFLDYQRIDENYYKDFFVDIKEIKGKPREIAKIKFEVIVSSGTYIRSLVNDLGYKLRCGGCLSSLERRKIYLEDDSFLKNYGQSIFSVNEALTFADLENNFLEFQARIFGFVQGVNFRTSVCNLARELNLTGWVKNREDGSVEVLAQGREEPLQKLISFLKKGPTLAKVDKVKIIFRYPLTKFENFSISY